MPETPLREPTRSLLELLPEIVRAGKRRAEQILEGLQGGTRISLQTRELVSPAKDTAAGNFALPTGAVRGAVPKPAHLRRQSAGNGRAAGRRRPCAVAARED